MAVELGADRAEHRAHLGHDQQREPGVGGELGALLVGEHGHRAAPGRVGGEAGAVHARAGQRRVQVAGAHRA